MNELDCQHEAVPLPEVPLVSYSALPEAGGSRYTSCKHCGAPMLGARDTRHRWTIWGWREAHGYDPYQPSPVDPPRGS